jgi:hypothetical protein
VLPFTLLPVVLEGVHLGSLLGPFCIIKGMLETALLALPDEEEDKQGEENGSGPGGTSVNASFGTARKIVPFF